MAPKLYDPTGPTNKVEALSFAPRPDSLEGLRVGLVENTKFNSENILRKVAHRLSERHGMTLVHVAHKKSSSHALDEGDIREFKLKADFVIAGVGD